MWAVWQVHSRSRPANASCVDEGFEQEKVFPLPAARDDRGGPAQKQGKWLSLSRAIAAHFGRVAIGATAQQHMGRRAR
eukprot:414541-Rhodomonas_salina.1